MPDSPETIQLIKQSLEEDIGRGDPTTEALISAGTRCKAVIICRSGGVLCGLGVVSKVFSLVSSEIGCRSDFQDGKRIRPGDEVVHLEGPARALLTGERVALNFLSHLSGVATATRRLVDAVGDKGPIILDTRKTIPGLRRLQRYAVRIGGGENHRYDLSEMILIKDNHLALTPGISEAVKRVKSSSWSHLPVEIEVGNLQQLQEALENGVDRIMLDNMDPETIRQAVILTEGRVPLEVSGGVTIESVSFLAGTGVSYISSGALTHSVQAVDFSLEVTPEP